MSYETWSWYMISERLSFISIYPYRLRMLTFGPGTHSVSWNLLWCLSLFAQYIVFFRKLVMNCVFLEVAEAHLCYDALAVASFTQDDWALEFSQQNRSIKHIFKICNSALFVSFYLCECFICPNLDATLQSVCSFILYIFSNLIAGLFRLFYCCIQQLFNLIS